MPVVLVVLGVLTMLALVGSQGAVARVEAADLVGFERTTDRDRQIYLMNANGTNQLRLATGCCFDWSPDGRRIAFVNDGIYVINVDGTGLRLLVTPNAPLCCDLDWSPDGRRIAFVGWCGGIRVIKSDGSGALTHDGR